MKKINRKCPLCSETNTSLIFTDHNRREWYIELTADYVECRDCWMKYLTKIPDLSSITKKYEDIYVTPDLTSLKNKIKPNIQNNWCKVLDIWCNHGTQLIKYKNP